MNLKQMLIAATLLAEAFPARACWQEAAERYGVNPYILYAIAKTESGLNPRAFNRNKDGSYDIGLMQINSSWLPTLKKFDVTEKQLYDPCTSIHVGAWILSASMRKHGNTWDAVGAYNSSKPVYRQRYALKVYQNIPLVAFNYRTGE